MTDTDSLADSPATNLATTEPDTDTAKWDDPLEKLFVYGIFLDKQNRTRYGMSSPAYDTVKDYITCGDHIVQAFAVPHYMQASLTGLVVNVSPTIARKYEEWDGELRKTITRDYTVDTWDSLDALEAGYDRIKIKTISGVEAWMYVAQ